MHRGVCTLETMERGHREGGPALVGANWYRFGAAERIHHLRVDSVAFIWVVKGLGVIDSGGQRYPVSAGAILRLPWGHDVDYHPDAQSPFHVGTIHLIPRHDGAVPVEPRVAFRPDDPLLGAAWRRGPDERESVVLTSNRSASGRNLIALASYGVERFHSGRVDEPALRALGELIANESADWATSQPSPRGNPTAVDLMTDFILAHLDRPLTVAQIAAAGDCSPTTAERLFARHDGQVGRRLGSHAADAGGRAAASHERPAGQRGRAPRGLRRSAVLLAGVHCDPSRAAEPLCGRPAAALIAEVTLRRSPTRLRSARRRR